MSFAASSRPFPNSDEFVRPSESTVETQPQLQPALLRLSAPIYTRRIVLDSDNLIEQQQIAMTERKPEPLEDEHERKFRRIFAWVFFLGASMVCIITLFFAIQAAFFSHYLAYTGASPQLAEFFREHFPVTIGLPVAAVISLLLILVLRETTGKLEFEALGFKFRGASGPVVLWVLCYLAITLSIKLLW